MSIKSLQQRLNALNHNIKLLYFVVYSLLFLIISICVFSWFWKYNKTFIWSGEAKDGLVQHYNSLVYYGGYLRSIIKELFKNHNFSIPMWDFSIGYGSDIITSLHYYVVGDPLNFLSVFFSDKNMEYLYCGLVVLRLYLSGLAFSAYCFWMGKNRFATLAGSFVYAFCGFALTACIRHPFFINPMIYLPLLLVGAEKIFAGQRPNIFIITIFISAVSNFYFFYMLTVLLSIYITFRYFMIFKTRRLKESVNYLLKFGSSYITGLMMAAVIFFPVVLQFFGTDRHETGYVYDTFYHLAYYAMFVFSFISSGFESHWTILGFSAIAAVGIIMLFVKRKDHKVLFAGFILLTVFLCVPFFGHALNGFSYVCNRWIWGYSFLVAYILVTVLPEMSILNKKEKRTLVLLAALYTAACFVLKNTHIESAFVACILLLIILRIALPSGMYKTGKNAKAAMLVLTAAGIVLVAYFKYSPVKENYVSEFGDVGSGITTLSETRDRAVTELSDDSFFRFDQTDRGKTFLKNSALHSGLNSLSYFFSLSNGNIASFFKEVNNTNVTNYIYTGVDERAALEALSSVKYYVVEGAQEKYVPYGFERIGGYGTIYSVYENKYALPLGYTYDSYIAQNEYQALKDIEKQQALLQGVVLEKEIAFRTTDIKLSDSSLEYKLALSDGVKLDKDGFHVEKEGATATLSFEGLKNSETYISFNNLWYKGIGGDAAEDAGILSGILHTVRLRSEPSSALINVSSSGVSKSICVCTPKYTWYSGKHDFLTNLCYSETERTEITLGFDERGIYSFDELKVICQPMEDYARQVKRLREDTLEDVIVKNNRVSGSINLSQDKILCLSIPYSSGWSAEADGKKADLLKANTMFMALALPPGEHDVKLTYCTPGIKWGLLLSLFGAAVFAGSNIIRKARE